LSPFDYAFAFVLLLSILIFVHELGHFLVAKACGVRVLKFSLGFGPPVGIGRFRLRWTRGHTEYVVAWFPLGGFVKMLGENPDEVDDPTTLAHPDETLGSKPTWQKLAIVFAGPAMNLLLPVAIFMGTLAIGVDRPAPVIGSIEPGSPAAEAGLRPGDRVVRIAGREAAWWNDVDGVLRERPGKAVGLEVERDGQVRSVTLVPEARSGFDEFGGRTQLGWSGLAHPRVMAVLGVASADSPARVAGIRSGDRVLSVDGQPAQDWESFAAAYAAASGEAQLELARPVERGEAPEELTLRVPALGSAEALGVVPANALIAAVSPDSPASRAGLAQGDLILSVDGEPIASFADFAHTIVTSSGRELEIGYARKGVPATVRLEPELIATDTGLGFEEDRYRVGIQAEVSNLMGATALDRIRNPLVSFPRAVAMTADMTGTFLQGLVKIVTGEVPRNQLAGPIGIAEIAGKAMERGWETYLTILVLISINLGILNLLPIPILDGGQAVIFTVEAIRRAPLSLRAREIFQQVGFTMLILLMGLAFWNDISRNWSRVVDWLGSAGS
jgi:regulator of sigma E protease